MLLHANGQHARLGQNHKLSRLVGYFRRPRTEQLAQWADHPVLVLDSAKHGLCSVTTLRGLMVGALNATPPRTETREWNDEG